MKLYLDSSALLKLVQRETESNSLRRFLRRHRDDRRVTSALARVEVVRAVAGGGPAAIAHARRQLVHVDQVAIDRDLLDAASMLVPGEQLRSLDAIHLASAHALAPDLRAVVTYDRRMAAAGVALGMVIEAPG